MSDKKNLKPIVITTKASQAPGSEFIWNKLQNKEVFISGIVTQEVNIENSDELSKLISGIPTPFARSAMFKYAINYVGQNDGELSGLMAFYKTLQNEWKGLIACIALDNQPISVEKISLHYSDNKNLDETSNIYEPKGAFGNMLFEEKEMWCDQSELEDSSKKVNPFINVIRYNGIVIGATSPESLLFTAPVYNININKGFYSQLTKKFTDPLKSNLSFEDVEKLYVYVKHIENSIDNYRNQFIKLKPDVMRISVFLNNWLTEIKQYAASKEYKIDENAVVPNLNKFKAPFDRLFNYQTTLFGKNGIIYSNLNSAEIEGAIEVELGELLLDPDSATVAEIIFDYPSDVNLTGVHMLKAYSDKGDKYFTLPLSEKGLMIFQDEIEGLLQIGGNVKSQLSAVYEMSNKSLQITLQVDVNGNTTSFTKNYQNPIKINGQKIICWPDFVSKIWNKYYLYSEIPHNNTDIKAFPLRANKNDFSLQTIITDGSYRFKKIAVNGKKLLSNDNAELLIEYDVNKLGSTDLKYEIYESNDPYKGVEFQINNKLAGYLVFKNITSGNPNSLKDYRSLKTTLNPARVGFDFGSNNTCISFAEQGGQPALIKFKNRRRFLLGIDSPSNTKLAAMPNEVFFFQNEEIQSNQIKSMVMIHDERRVKQIEEDPKIILKREVKGGFPVFEKNIPVEASAETTYTLKFDNQPSHIKFNMKWSSDEKENAYKQGLLKLLWLKTYAELLDIEKFPESLVWAYPSSMNKQILLKYGILWNEVGQVNPLKSIDNSGVQYNNAKVAQFSGSFEQVSSLNTGFGGSFTSSPFKSANGFGSGQGNLNNLDLKAETEAASVCKHALGVGFQTGGTGLIIGFDVGGSTTDILCISTKKDRNSKIPDDFKDTLIKQSSIKFAAGRLADSTSKSKKFQDVLKSFCRKKDLHIHGITVPPERLNNNTSTYYYNLIVDYLTNEEDLNEFYQNLAADCPELFTVNSFMTGLIMFYAGQLAYKIKTTRDENPADYLASFDQIMIGCFGKGGRMFDWLRAMNTQAAKSYYETCFIAGYGNKALEDIKYFEIRYSDSKYVKAEVSFGLSRYNDIHTTSEQISELIGEEGYAYNGAIIDQLDSVEPNYMKNFGNQFSTPKEFKRFSEFAKIFYSFSKEYFGFNLPTIEQDINNMRLKAYIENIPEFQLAKRSQEFDFETPVIILESMCFLDTILTPKLFGN
ncbi:MAG: hypothetical protein JST55_16535 [Bacteroidetes bacterium]|nr:hypothetical protein [Bacteroidota bacterium]